ncbi:MAG: 3-hydroxybutyrate dehydrogenase [Candidatus Puniceispirillum sp.]|nr:3-hydroxybutyrate dehydrogenase [Candidatus Puniceispirillum sp.]MBT6566789.1 3-hydroxybutyrate dehydrogenase [Candidatus Puniceispirillum sp.]
MDVKHALVTGATSGIGLAIARALASEGMNISIGGLGTDDEIADICNSLMVAGAHMATHDPADMRDPKAVRAMIDKAAKRFGGIGILINNAGIQHVAPVAEFPIDKWDDVLAINLSAVFHASAAAAVHMTAADWGRIINISSVHGLVASPDKAAYVAAKHGVIGLTKTMALEHARGGITVNAICPGWVRTPLVEQQIVARAKESGKSLDEEASLLVADKMPSGTFTEADDVAATVQFLCGSASASITGTSLIMDGGWTAQ